MSPRIQLEAFIARAVRLYEQEEGSLSAPHCLGRKYSGG